MIRVCAGILLVAFGQTCWAKLPKLNIDIEQTTISGLSSGGYMATQLHYAHSEWITGVGIIAAGPYLCADGDIKLALSRCVNSAGDGVPLERLKEKTDQWRSAGKLAPLTSFENDKVWLFHGSKDEKLVAAVNDLLMVQYQQLLTEEAVSYIDNKPFAHHFPTPEYGIQCASSQAPFLGNCKYDAAGKMLTYLYDGLSAPSPGTAGKLLQFNQHDLAGESADSLAEEGYLYIPQNCQQGESCKLHISFHGCNQNAQAVDSAYAKHTGLNNWADTNNLVVLYPQTKKSLFMPLNPQACWDWWGYTGEDYANKSGPQIEAIKRMAYAISGKTEE